ncbi:hypothetical protein QL989_08075 [Pseudoalteromonas sp. APC 3224]|uniref:hypothetical protein n=1 Tax=Pseudoalteromonas sp. APC 3224 TaxID=3035203 RepID=UPI0025B5ACB9|nr:hypothetical protein [Pseudoalteromonas sp. APC 3224]MDN3485297.1 hypothetical protein [Pseudoalteromonas sp. APC 3224]
MTKVIKLNENIYHLLVEKNFNHFTITTLRNTLQAINDTYKDPDEVRRFVYRQVMRLVNKGLLIRDSNPSPKKAQYSKTSLFKASLFTKVVKSSSLEFTKSKEDTECFQSELEQKKTLYEEESLMIASEIEEYIWLNDKYPNNREIIVGLLKKKQLRLLSLKGKLAALNNVQELK